MFGAEFNDIFLVHIALLTLSIWATALAVASLDVGAVAAAFRVGRAARWVGGFLVLVGSILGGLWIFLAIRFAVTGELMADIPADGIHLVFAIDLSLLVPALVVGACSCGGERGSASSSGRHDGHGRAVPSEPVGRGPVPGECRRGWCEGVPPGGDRRRDRIPACVCGSFRGRDRLGEGVNDDGGLVGARPHDRLTIK